MASPIGSLLHHPPEWALSWWDVLYKLPLGKYHILEHTDPIPQKEQYSLKTTYLEAEVALSCPQ